MDQNEEWWSAMLRTTEIARQQSRFDDSTGITASLANANAPKDSRAKNIAKQIAAKALARNAASAEAD